MVRERARSGQRIMANPTTTQAAAMTNGARPSNSNSAPPRTTGSASTLAAGPACFISASAEAKAGINPHWESDGLQQNQVGVVSTELRSSDYRSDVFALGPSPRIAEFPRICWGERIRTSDWLIQNQLPYRLATPQRAFSAVEFTGRGLN